MQPHLVKNLELLYPDLPRTHLFKTVDTKQWETLLYSFCLELDPELESQWHNVYPPLIKQQSRDLRLNVFKFLETVKKSGLIPSWIMFRKSDIEDMRGPRFERLVMSLCHIIMQKRIGQLQVDQSLSKVQQIKGLQDVLQVEQERLGILEDHIQKKEREWVDLDRRLTDAIQLANQDISGFKERHGSMEALQEQMVQKQQALESVKADLKQYDVFLAFLDTLERYDPSLLELSTIDGDKLHPRLSEYAAQLLKSVDNVDLYPQGTLNLNALATLWQRILSVAEL